MAAAYPIGRGCRLPPTDGDLRWTDHLRHPDGGYWPALVALVTHAETAAPLTLHSTWLAADGSGKAPLPKNRVRLVLPGRPTKHGVIRLWNDASVTLGLAVAKGIETSLVAAQGFQPVWSCMNAGNLGSLRWLAGIDALTIVADHDPAGIRAANSCGQRWADAGCDVRIWQAPADGADLNDYALGAP